MKKIFLFSLCSLVLMACDPSSIAETATTVSKFEQEAEKARTEEPSTPELRNGLDVSVNPDTKVRNEVNYKDGVREGESKAFYPSGAIWKSNTYVNNRMHGPARIYYEDGKVKRESHYADGIRDGAYVENFKSGNPRFETSYLKGRPLIGYKDRDYKGELKPNPEVSYKVSRGKNGENLELSFEFSLGDFKLDRGTEVAYYLLEKGIKWEEIPAEELPKYRIPRGSSPQTGNLKTSLEPEYFLDIKVPMVAVFEHHSDVKVAVLTQLNIHEENSFGIGKTRDVNIGHE